MPEGHHTEFARSTDVDAHRILTQLGGLVADERVLVVSDQQFAEDARRLAESAEGIGATVERLALDEDAPDGHGSRRIAERVARGAIDVVVESTRHSRYDAPAMHEVLIAGARLIGVGGADLATVANVLRPEVVEPLRLARAGLAEVLRAADRIEIRSGEDDRLTMRMRTRPLERLGRRALRRGVGDVFDPTPIPAVRAQLAFVPGQLALMPDPASLAGSFVVNGAIHAPGVDPDVVPDRIVIRRGSIERFEGAPALEAARSETLDRAVRHVCLGFLPHATFDRSLMESERVMGAVTIGFAHYPIHSDVVGTDVAISVDGVPLLERGRWVHPRLAPLFEAYLAAACDRAAPDPIDSARLEPIDGDDARSPRIVAPAPAPASRWPAPLQRALLRRRARRHRLDVYERGGATCTSSSDCLNGAAFAHAFLPADPERPNARTSCRRIDARGDDATAHANTASINVLSLAPGFDADALAVDGWLRLPLFLGVGRRLDDVAEHGTSVLKRSVTVGDLQRMRRAGLTDHWMAATPGRVARFHERYYVPTVRASFGSLAGYASYAAFFAELEHAQILEIRDGDEPIAAGLFRLRGDAFVADQFGLRDGARTASTRFGMVAIYHAMFRHGAEIGARSIDMGRVVPLLLDGVLSYKSKWIAEDDPYALRVEEGDERTTWLRVDPRDATARRALAESPPALLLPNPVGDASGDDHAIIGCWWGRDAATIDDKELRRQLRALACPGLECLVVLLEDDDDAASTRERIDAIASDRSLPIACARLPLSDASPAELRTAILAALAAHRSRDSAAVRRS